MQGDKKPKANKEQPEKYVQYNNLKEVFVAILIGACVSFLATLFEGLADFLRANAEQLAGGATTVAYWLAKRYRV